MRKIPFLQKKPVGRNRSLLHRFNVQFIITMLIFAALLIVVSVSFILNLRSSSYKTVHDALGFYDDAIVREMDSDILSLMDSCTSDPDIVKIRTTRDKNEEVGCLARIQRRLSSQVSTLSMTRGFFLYYYNKNIYIPAYNSSGPGYSSGYPFPSFIREYLRKCIASGGVPDAYSKNWFLIKEHNCLIRIFYTGGIYGGAWIDLNDLPGFDDFSGTDAIQLITNEDGRVLYASNSLSEEGYKGEYETDLTLPVLKSVSDPTTMRISGLGNRIVVSFKQSFSDYYFTILMPMSQFLRSFQSLFILLLLLVLWGVLFFLAYNRMGQKIIELPTESLMTVTNAIRSGNIENSVAPPNDYEETVQIIDAFNKLISEIGTLRISVYEEQLSAREFELKALKNQVAPHFLINCLNTIFMSAQDHSRIEVTNQLISTLSSHLRYTLSDRDIVPLTEELDYLENYILLTQYRFPDTLKYENDIDPDVLHAQVFSMILLTLTENSIKTGLIMGEPFLIRVRAYKKTEDGKDFVYLEHTDSGTGLSEEKLEKYNNIFEHPEVTEKGTGIGLYNTAMRLRLLLGTDASLNFANEEGMGLRVTIRFPYMEYQENGGEVI